MHSFLQVGILVVINLLYHISVGISVFGGHLILTHTGSVFISDDNHSVYLVNSIIDSWGGMFPVPTPTIAKTTLLPFRDVIVSDGLVSAFLIRFGRNMVDGFKETYMTEKKNKALISQI